MKKNKYLFRGILALTLIFGLVLTGCPSLTGADNGGNGDNGGSLEEVANGKASDVFKIDGETTIDEAFKGRGGDGYSSLAEFIAAGGELYVNGTKVISGSYKIKPDDTVRILFPKTNNNGNNNRGEQIGKISGAITLTDVPDPRPDVYISASGGNWNSYSSPISLSGVSGSTANGIAWEIPLYENDGNGALKGKTGTETISFSLYVQNSGSSNGFQIRLDSRSLSLDDKSDIKAGDLGTVSIASVTLSGTVKINSGGSPVPRVYISAYKPDGNSRSYLGSASLESPDTAGASWSMPIPVQSAGTEVTFSVGASDADGNSLFNKEFSPDAAKSVSNQPVSGIVLDAGDISVGRMSGTVTFTNVPSPPPYRITLSARYGYDDNNNGGKYVNGGSGATVTLNGNTGTWSVSRDDDFLAALTNGDQRVQFYLYITLNEGENGNSLSSIEKTISKNGMSAVDLGSVAIPNYIKLSGTFTGTYNGGTLPNVNLYPRTQEGQSLGNGAYLRTPSAGTSWSTYIPALDSSTRIIFSVSAYSSSGNTTTNLFGDLRVSPSQTQAVSSRSVSGIVINIGDIKSDTLTVTNPPPGSYTAYITDTYINQNNYASVINSSDNKATGTGSGSSITLSWDSSVDKSEYKSYCVLIKAGETVKYSSWVSLVNGIGLVDWNDMTEVSGNGNDNGNGNNNGNTLSPDIDSQLIGTWVHDAPMDGDYLTMTFSNSTVTWSGTLGSGLDGLVGTYQGLGYTSAWIAKDGDLSWVYIHPSTGKQTLPLYGYKIEGGKLLLTTSGITFATLVKQ